jgi:hypothetical protein
MAYTNKNSAKRKHKKYRRRTKKGGVVRLVINPVNSQAISRQKSPNKELDEAAVFQGVANDYTKAALDNALSIFSHQAQAPAINVTVHGKSRAQSKRQGPTPGQIKKAEQKALAKELKAAEKAAKKAKQEEEKVAKEVTKAAVNQEFSTMFGNLTKGTGPKSRKRK